MAVTADPLWINVNAGAPSYTANELRLAMGWGGMYDGRLNGARPGIRPGANQFQVTVVSTTLTVQPGMAIVDPAGTTTTGSYWVNLPTADTFTLNAPDATNPRHDIVVLRVYDNDEDSSGLRLARSEYIAGTAAPSPVDPTTPTGSIKLCSVNVPQSGGGAAVVTDLRPFTVAPGGILPVRATGDITAGTAGRYRDRLDTNVLERDNGSTWVTAADPVVFTAWTSFTPVLNGLTGHSATGESLTGTYKLVGKTVHIRIRWQIGSGAVGTGTSIGFDLPVSVLTGQTIAALLEDNSASTRYSGVCFITAGGTTGANQRIIFGSNIAALSPTAPITLAQNDIVIVQGTLEVT